MGKKREMERVYFICGGNSFLEYRIRKLLEAGIFVLQGSLEVMRFYSIRFKC
nr:DUF3658 domain-containing protein [Metabacillus niabensis]